MRAEDNERLARVGPGSPAGEMLRRYWHPVLLASELPASDSAPLRVRILGEDLIAFRDSAGEVGLVDAYCPHRRAPLFFGRIEDCGIRCVYHGWKFDRQGNCLDMPSEPEGSPLMSKVKLKAYPTFEAGDLVWAYLGPKGTAPSPADYEWLRAPVTHRFVSKTYQSSNYLQGLEGGLDTAHVGFLHSDDRNPVTRLASVDRSPKLNVETTPYGFYYTSTRRMPPDKNYTRIYQYILPAQQMRPSVIAGYGQKQDMPTIDGHIWVPIDDVSCHVYNFIYSFDRAIPLSDNFIMEEEAFFGRAPEDYIPGSFRLKRNSSNNYLVDRTLQKQGNFSGIQGINTQDMALQEGMGAIVDRSKEFLGSSDKAIVTMRRLLLEAIHVVESGDMPRGSHPHEHSKVRAYEDIVESSVPIDHLLVETIAKW
jgi:phthalate 4,5-dioxygenase oxygenase subunit